MLQVINEDKIIKDNNIITVPLKRIQLDYSPNVIKYIQVKKNADIKNLFEILNKRKNPQIYELSVYKKGIDLYHVYGQETGSWGNAFILGSLLLDKSFNISDDKIIIMGKIHIDDPDKGKLEILNLNELFGGGFHFKRHPTSGEILPIYPLEGLSRKLVTTIHKNEPKLITVHKNRPITKVVHNLSTIQEVYPPPPFGCPEGFYNCVSNCNYYIHESKEDRRCGFICELGKDLGDCNESCIGYLKLPNKRHCCKHEFNSSCEYNKGREKSSWRKM